MSDHQFGLSKLDLEARVYRRIIVSWGLAYETGDIRRSATNANARNSTLSLFELWL